MQGMARFDERLLEGNVSDAIAKKTIELVGFFVDDTLNKMLRHVDRLNIRNTNTLRNSLKGVMQTNSGGNVILVRFWHAYYAEMVEQAVGKYWGVDADLGKGRGVKAANIAAPPIDSADYGSMRATFSGLPDRPVREKTHRPRPFFRSEIRRQAARISWRLMRDVGRLMEMHVVQVAEGALGSEELLEALAGPFEGSKRRVRTYFPKGGTQW